MTEYALPTRSHPLCLVLEYVLVSCVTSSAHSILGCCAYLTPLSYYHHTITHYHLLSHTIEHSLPKSRLPPAHEPPAEEAHEAPHDSDDSDGDACNGTRGEAAPVRAVSSSISAGAIVSLLLRYVTGDRAATTSWRGTADAVFYTSDLVVISTTSCALHAFIVNGFVVPC
eukprot:XP_001707367.1 Hypothetical protein GL50803_22124 [Giardia lamblia ATCC 50803]